MVEKKSEKKEISLFNILANNWWQIIVIVFTCGVSYSSLSANQSNMVNRSEYVVTQEKVERLEKSVDRLVDKLDYLATVIINESKR